MDFYWELYRHYDELFAVDPAEMRGIAALFEGARLLLHIGCGAGSATVHLAAPGRRVIGIDPDAAMVAKAREKAGAAGIRYETLHLLDLDKQFAGLIFDGMAWLDDSLALLSVEDIGLALEKAHTMLAEGGRLVIRLINYDRVLDNCVCALPDIDTKNATLTRAYRKAFDGLHCLTSLRLKDRGRVFSNDAVRFPLRRNTLAGMLAGIGFDAPDWYGDRAGNPLSPDSLTLIAACRKESAKIY